MIYNRFVSFISLLLISISLFSQGYEINVNAPQFANSDVILVEYFTSRMVPKDTVHLNEKGIGILSGDTKFKGGLYVLFFNQRNYLDFMMDDNFSFSISADTTDLVHLTKFIGSKNNTLFYDYKAYLAKNKKLNEEYLEDYKTAKTKKDSAKVEKKLKDLNIKIKIEIDELTEKHSGTFFATFLSSMKEPSPPKEMLVGSNRQIDSVRFMYNRKHFFDHFDIGDVRLLHTPIYDNKIKLYLNRYAPQHPDSLIIACDMLMEESRKDEEIFRYMLITLFNKFADSKLMGMDKVYFHMAENYYIPEATWSGKEFIDKLKVNLEKSRYTFINNPAKDFELIGLPKEHIHMAEMDIAIKEDPNIGYRFNLYTIPAEYTILYFWESDCGHCKKSTPKLYEVFKKYENQNVEALAVHVINSVEGKVKWLDFINEYELFDWVNCWSPYDTDFRKDYNLQSFPQLFLLDKDKKIVAKMLSPEQADEILGKLLNIK